MLTVSMQRLVLLLGLLSGIGFAQTVDLLAHRTLDQWEVVGNGLWAIMKDGTVVGQRDLTVKAPRDPQQSWLYTKAEFDEFDLDLDYWTRIGGNSGVSIRDTTRGQYSFGEQADLNRTPSHVGYEIQISNGYKDKYPTGSIYHFAGAPKELSLPTEWNHLRIESRHSGIRVLVNGVETAQYAGDPQRPLKGPIGLQLHDNTSIVMFRNIKLKEIKSAK